MNRRRIIVQKYGGSSVATLDKLRRVAALVVERRRQGFDLVVVVSAMGDTTDELLDKAKALSGDPDRRELDMLLSTGERISMALLAIAIREAGLEAVSLTGSQSGIITTANHASARIIEVRPFRVEDELELGKVVIVAGYQGVSYRRDVTTLGRGGSDTTAVALAAALSAEACEIYSDVDGVFSADPRIVPEARKLDAIGYEEMQELAQHGARVLNAQAVQFAKEKGIAIYARKTGSADPGTVIRRDVPKTTSGVRGIAHEARVATIRGTGLPLARVRALIEVLEGLGAPPRALVTTDQGNVFATLALDDVHNEAKVRDVAVETLGLGAFRDDLGAVSLVGEGVLSSGRVALDAMRALEAEGIETAGLSTTAFRVTLAVPSDHVARSVRCLHRALGLDGAVTEAVLA